MQKLVRKKMREYEKHGFSEHFKELKKKVKERVKLEGEKALNKVFENATGKGTNGSENQLERQTWGRPELHFQPFHPSR